MTLFFKRWAHRQPSITAPVPGSSEATICCDELDQKASSLILGNHTIRRPLLLRRIASADPQAMTSSGGLRDNGPAAEPITLSEGRVQVRGYRSSSNTTDVC